MKILSFTTLYPNAAQPYHGIFVENRLRHVAQSDGVELKVVAPVPWVPSLARVFGNYAAFAKVPAEEERYGISILHPRYPVIPKVGMTLAPGLMYRATRRLVTQIAETGYDFDLIDAHYFYPDGVAAALLGRRLGKPVVITARGTDINHIPRFTLPRRMIRWAADESSALIAVAQALADEMVAIGIDSDKIAVLRNGVDLDRFRPLDRAALRNQYGLSGPVIISVGHLIPRKGHDLVVRAMTMVPDATLLIVGQGSEAGALNRLVGELDLSARVRFLGGVPYEEMPKILNASDLLVLASDREGWANVLLEAMACGTPVAATNVWGAPEVIAGPSAGRLIAQRESEAIAETVRALLNDPPSREKVRAYAEGFSWDQTTKGQIDQFSEILEQRRAGPRLRG